MTIKMFFYNFAQARMHHQGSIWVSNYGRQIERRPKLLKNSKTIKNIDQNCVLNWSRLMEFWGQDGNLNKSD